MGRGRGESWTEEAYECKVVTERMAGIRMPKRERSRNVTSDRLTETALARLKRAVALCGVESCRSEVIIAVHAVLTLRISLQSGPKSHKTIR